MLVLLFIIDLIVGSFINVVIYRLPNSVMGGSISPSNPNRSYNPEWKYL